LLQKLWVTGTVDVVPVVADDAAPAQLITLILVTDWCYIKNGYARNNICTLTLLSTRKKIIKIE